MKKFLVVEDDRISSTLLVNFLSNFAVCDSAPNGKAGFELFEKALTAGQPYDLICSDVVMPEVDGHELIRNIRAREAATADVCSPRSRIFMVSTSDATSDITQAILDNDCDDYIVKPFHRDSLKATLLKYDLIEQDTKVKSHQPESVKSMLQKYNFIDQDTDTTRK
jgi:two-component system chemotaxis response regulator CheY